MKVELIEQLGTDLTVVNAARVSFNKRHEYLEDADEKLIKYLAVHGHWTPFAHPQLQFRISAPILVARQLVKHQIGLVWNEVSRRYVDYEPEYYVPSSGQWRGKPTKAKQGSEGTMEIFGQTEKAVSDILAQCTYIYKELLEQGVAPEQARLVLPQAMYTEWYWTGSLAAFARVCTLRLSSDAQEETREIARQIGDFCAKLFPISWKYLV